MATLSPFDHYPLLGKQHRIALFSTNNHYNAWAEGDVVQNFWLGVIEGFKGNRKLDIWDQNGEDEVERHVTQETAQRNTEDFSRIP